MCNSKLHNFLAHLPKCEHHIHLEGCLTPEIVFTLAAKNNIPLPQTPTYSSPETLKRRYEHFDCLEDFLQCHYLAMSVLIEAQDFELIAWEYFSHSYVDGVRHAEVFFDPQSHTQRGVPFATILDGYSRACRRAEEELGMTTKLVMCFLRHLPALAAMETLQAAIDCGGVERGDIAGVGLDSSEVGFPAELFVDAFQTAKSKGLNRTAHGGEEGDPSYIAGAIDALDCTRIDHGLRLPEDPALMARVAKEGILLTLCPFSNVCLGAIKSIEELPIRKFIAEGVKFSINSDDPAYCRGYVLGNYCAVQEVFDLSLEDWMKIAQDSIDCSWADDERKAELWKGVLVCKAEYGYGS
jgi:adenosine deaminase